MIWSIFYFALVINCMKILFAGHWVILKKGFQVLMAIQFVVFSLI